MELTLFIKDLYKKYKKFLKYCVIGCSGALLDFIFFTILTNQFSLHYQFANIISVSFGITNNFLLNAFLNFKVSDNLFKRFLTFYSIGIIGLLISSLILFVLVEKLSCNVLISKFLTIFVVTLVQFSLNKLITFKKADIGVICNTLD